MREAEALKRLQDMNRPVIETGEAVARLGISSAYAGKLLRSLERSGHMKRLMHGRWLLDLDADPFSIPPYLTAPYPAYVSLWSALSRHGMIDQIPRQVFVVSPDRPRTIETPVGTYAIHRIAPEVFGGYTGNDKTGFIATPEKALFDSVYLPASRRQRIYLPELGLPQGFNAEVLDEWAAKIRAGWLKSKVVQSLADVIATASSA